MALQSAGPVFLVGNALFLAARLGNQDIPKILPERPVLSEVNLDGDLAPFNVGYELNSRHGFIPLPKRSRGARPARVLQSTPTRYDNILSAYGSYED